MATAIIHEQHKFVPKLAFKGRLPKDLDSEEVITFKVGVSHDQMPVAVASELVKHVVTLICLFAAGFPPLHIT